MKRRALIILVALFQFFWMNVLAPGHTRGAITLPDGTSHRHTENASKKPACCLLFGNSQKGSEPTQDQKDHCLVCHIVAGYTLPPVYSYDLHIAGCVVERLETVNAQVAKIHFALPFYPHGPPAMS